MGRRRGGAMAVGGGWRRPGELGTLRAPTPPHGRLSLLFRTRSLTAPRRPLTASIRRRLPLEGRSPSGSDASAVLPQDNRHNIEVIRHVKLELSARVLGMDM